MRTARKDRNIFVKQFIPIFNATLLLFTPIFRVIKSTFKASLQFIFSLFKTLKFNYYHPSNIH